MGRRFGVLMFGVLIFIALSALAACGSEQSSQVDAAGGSGAQAQAATDVINWQTLGCEQPAALIVESSAALETDVGLAADSVAQQYGITIEEASRRLRLQEILGRRLADIQTSEAGRVARTELQHEPYFAAVVTLTGTAEVSEATRDTLCSTPELEVRLGAGFTQDELVAETNRFATVLADFGPGLVGWGPGDGQLEFTVIDSETAERLDAIIASSTDYPYTIHSLDIAPLMLDPTIPFPLLDVTGRASAGVGLSGVLTIEGACVYLDDRLVVLPARETTWDAATGVLNTGGGDIRSGDRVTGGGNVYTGPLDELDQPPDPACRLDGGVVQGSFAPVDPNATPAPAPPPLPPGDLPGMRVHRDDPGEGMDAEVVGVLEVGDGCVWLNGDGTRYPVVWPVLTFGRAEPPEIVLPGGDVARHGDRVEGSGGYVDAANVTAGLGLNPFPEQCIYSGEAAVFNPGSAMRVTPGVGIVESATLVDRFAIPQPIGLELVAVSPNDGSIVVVDFVTAEVHRYDRDAYIAPPDAVDGASRGGGFIHLWSGGTVYSYAGSLRDDPVVFSPDPIVQLPGTTPLLRVVPTPDGERVWLVQANQSDNTTQIELVDLVESQVTRLSTAEVDGVWEPAGATTAGLVVTTGAGGASMVVDHEGNVVGEQQGHVISVGWNGTALVRPDGSLVTTDARLVVVDEMEKPVAGEWRGVGGPIIPSEAPPLVTATDRYLVGLGARLVLVDNGNSRIISDATGTPAASWSRGGDWVILIDGRDLTLIPVDGGDAVPLGALIPDGHWVLAAG